eukprot:1142759-Pelagomonas_calceolata.AAC.2
MAMCQLKSKDFQTAIYNCSEVRVCWHSARLLHQIARLQALCCTVNAAGKGSHGMEALCCAAVAMQCDGSAV